MPRLMISTETSDPRGQPMIWAQMNTPPKQEAKENHAIIINPNNKKNVYGFISPGKPLTKNNLRTG